MASPLARVDFDSDVTRGVVTGLAFLVALAFNVDPQRRALALAVFGGGALAFFGLAFLASRDEQYGVPQLRWYLFAAWGALLFAVGLTTESTVGVLLGAIIAVYAAVRGWLFDALADESTDTDSSVTGDDGRPEEDDEEWTGDALPPHLQSDDGDDPAR